MSTAIDIAGLVLVFPMALGGALLLRAAEYVQRRGVSWRAAFGDAWGDFKDETR